MSSFADPVKEKQDPFASLDGRKQSVNNGEGFITVETLKDADEALSFLENHPRAAEIAAEGNAILEDPKQLKRLVRKIDLTIAPLLACVYFLQFLDKTTLSYTAVMGIRKDTHLKGQDYSNLSMLFYIGFLAAEFPTQYLAQRVSRLGMYLGVNIMIWGLILGFHGACTSFAGLAVVRTLLGVFESCVAPILVLIIAMWYKKEEQGRRVSWFYVCNSLTQIFAGCVAYGVSFAHGSFATWRIFYIAIGAMTMVVGLLVALLLPDSPVRARRFTDAQKVAALLRVKANQSGTQNAHIKPGQILESFKDIRIWLVCLATLLSSIPNGGLSNFTSILLTTFGYTSQQALILTAPSGAIGVVVVLSIGYLSDRWRDRSLVMIIVIVPTILSGCLMIGLDPNGIPKNKSGLLAASFLSGTFGAAFMLLLAWNASNIAGHSKKVTANALTLVAFAVGNILGTQTFQQKQAPGYKSGKISIIASLTALIFVIIALRLYNDHLNKVNKKALEGMSEAEKDEMREKMAFADQTDRKNPFFHSYSDSANCSSPTCSHDGTFHCAGCKSTAYCSQTCQKTHWPTHKKTCAATQKHNCYLVRAASSTDSSPLVDQISPLHLQHYGNEMAEIQEIKSRCGWSSVSEVGKFYDHLGTDSWYYYVYGQRKGKAERKSFNAALSMACGTTRGKEIYGDVAVIRSGPSNDEPVPERFTSIALAKALDFYKEKDCEQVFVEREKSRCGRKMEVDMSTVSAFEVRT